MDLKSQVAQVIHTSIETTLTIEQIQNLLEVPKHDGHGDIAFPCFIFAKEMRKAPQAIAQDLAPQMQGDIVDHVEAVGPYINFFLNQEAVAEEILTEIYQAGVHFGEATIGHGENITIDMSSPNIAKPMSMGHLRSTVIGNAIANIVRKVGFNPIRINHLGDWGTQFGKLIVGYKKWGSEEAVRENPISELLKYYVKFHEAAEEDETLDDEGRLWFKKLEDGDPEAYELWKWFKDESLKEFQRIYDMLGVEFDSYNGEAFYSDKMPAVIDELDEKGLLKVDRGATIVDLEAYNLNPALIKKSDGATLYITRDLATALYRKENYHFAQSLYVVGNEQSNHFNQLKAVLELMGYDWSADINHIPFGLITQNGKKLSTRKGNVILLEDVLNDAIELALKQINEKNPDLPNKEEVAHQVGVGAVIFHDLKNDRLNSFDFNLEEVVQFEGETGPYVQYANARAHSILRKADFNPENIAHLDSYDLDSEEAFQVLKELNRFPEIVTTAYEKYEPSTIAKYLLNLSQQFNKYYAHTRILTEDGQLQTRLALVYALTKVLESGLAILGVEAPSQM